MGEAKQKLLDAEGKLAEERLQVVEDRRKLEEQKQKFQQEMEQRQKDEQNLILGKKLGSGHKGNIQKYYNNTPKYFIVKASVSTFKSAWVDEIDENF